MEPFKLLLILRRDLITFRRTLDDNTPFKTILFVGKLVLGESPLNFSYSVKSTGSSLLGLSLLFSSEAEKKTSILLASGTNPLHIYNQLSRHFDSIVMLLHVEKIAGWIVEESSIAMDGYTLTEIGVACYDMKTSSGSSQYFAVLGHIAVRSPEIKSRLPPANSWVIDSSYIAWSSGSQDTRKLNMMLSCKLEHGDYDVLMEFKIYVKKISKMSAEEEVYVGAAVVEAFYVSDLEILDVVSSLKFIIQVSIDGVSQKLEDFPSYWLDI